MRTKFTYRKNSSHQHEIFPNRLLASITRDSTAFNTITCWDFERDMSHVTL